MKQRLFDKEIEFSKSAAGYQIGFADKNFAVDCQRINEHMFSLVIAGQNHTVFVAEDQRHLYFHVGGEIHTYPKGNESVDHRAGEDEHSGEQTIKAPMPGKIVKTFAGIGDKIAKGQKVLIVEAMKMEHEITARLDGVVEQMNVQAGDMVDASSVLAKIVAV